MIDDQDITAPEKIYMRNLADHWSYCLKEDSDMEYIRSDLFEKMKCCGNCYHGNRFIPNEGDNPCSLCLRGGVSEQEDNWTEEKV